MTHAYKAVALSLAGALTLLTVAPAFAAPAVATLDAVTGIVMISQGDGFVAVDAGLSLRAGDRVMVRDESQAEIAFGACAVTIAAQSVFVVPEKAPCKKGEAVAYVESGFVQPAMGSIGAVPPAQMIALGGAALALLGVGLLAANYNEPGPASPNGAPQM